MAETDDRLVTLQQAAAFLGISTRQVRRLIAAGQIAAWHPTPQVIRISERELHRRVYGAMGLEAPAAGPAATRPGH